ncbi:MAG TPA: hypothetical protein VL418_17870 [Devosiaceae bacterium]|nr:hypothetical protein [Devosiaceae bacterium]
MNSTRPLAAFGLLVLWVGIFAAQLLSHAAWEAGATFAGFLVATWINTEFERPRKQ